jgi:suppressor for copper-sensitivity B
MALLAVLVSLIGMPRAGAAAEPRASAWATTPHGAVRLVSAVSGTGDGAILTLGLQFALQPGWKIYWRSPGDAGYPPRIDWSGSENLAVARLAWPAPQRFTVLGFETIGYAGEVVLPIEATLTAAGRALKAEALVDYLTCDEICVPYTARLSLSVPAGPALPSAFAPVIGRFVGRVPAEVGPDTPAAALAIEDVAITGAADAIRLRVSARAETPFVAPDLFVEGPARLAFGAPSVAFDADRRRAVLTLPVFGAGSGSDPGLGDAVRLTLVDGERAIERELRPAPAGEASPAIRGPTAAAAPGLAHTLALAVLGGLILNLMPCVLPVLSIKLLSIASHGGEDRRRIRLGFLASSAGIVFSFAVLAAALSIVKLVGGSVGWGVQFQQPWFLAAMVVLVVLFACNLAGLFEVDLPAAIADAGARIGHARGLGGQFLLGALATLLATPCSAPFVGTALGFALSRGTVEIFAVLIAMGLGLALPYLAIAAVPGLVAHLPKPGRWMLALRRALAAALVVTALWLLSLLAGVGGIGAAIAVALVAALIPAALALARLRPGGGRGVAAIAAAALALAIVVAAPAGGPAERREGGPGPSGAGPRAPRPGGPWQAFAPERIAELVAAGRVVYVNVTADWCLTCKLNQQRVLARPPVDDWLADPRVVAMQGDWTRADPAIARYLAGFGRYGIPFDAVYGPGLARGEALPELLTPSAVQDALARAGAGAWPTGSSTRPHS